MTELTFTITGMHCASCGLLIDDAIEDLPGVTTSTTNHRTRPNHRPARQTQPGGHRTNHQSHHRARLPSSRARIARTARLVDVHPAAGCYAPLGQQEPGTYHWVLADPCCSINRSQTAGGSARTGFPLTWPAQTSETPDQRIAARLSPALREPKPAGPGLPKLAQGELHGLAGSGKVITLRVDLG